MTSGDAVSRLRKLLVVGAIVFLLCWILPYPFFSAWRDSLRYTGLLPTLAPQKSERFETVLVIWLDDASSPAPILDGLWLAYVPVDKPEADLVGLPPADYQNQLSNILGPSPETVLQPYVRGSFAGIIVMDRADLVELADALGGVYILGETTDGQGLLNYLAAADVTQPDDLLIRQGAVIQSLLVRIAVQGKHIDLARLLDTPSLCSLDKSKVGELVGRFYPLRVEAVRVHPLIDSATLTP